VAPVLSQLVTPKPPIACGAPQESLAGLGVNGCREGERAEERARVQNVHDCVSEWVFPDR
jgi:hypothetical protein